MMDISDGLAADAQHLAAASEVGIEVNLEHIPCWENVAPLAAVASGAEFEVLCTMPPTFGDASISAFRSQTRLQFTPIGSRLRLPRGRRGGGPTLRNNKSTVLPPRAR